MQWMIESEQQELKPLFEATRKGNIQFVKDYISKHTYSEAIKQAVNYSKKTLLHVAWENGHTVLVEFFLIQGHNPNSRDKML